jgi:hypothetical protein
MNWDEVITAARESFREGVNEWISQAMILGGKINGPNAEIPSGSLISPVQFEPNIVRALVKAGAPTDVANGLAKELWSAWKAWADGYSAILPGVFPTFAAVAGPAAPPTRAIPFPISRGSSSGEVRLQAGILSQALKRAVSTPKIPVPDKAVQSLAGWVESSFTDWKKLSTLSGLMGEGRATGYAPPYVPVGPVVMGDATSSPAGGLISGPRFGKVVL